MDRYNQGVLEREIEIELAQRLMSGDASGFDRFVEHFRNKIFQYSWLSRGRKGAVPDDALT